MYIKTFWARGFLCHNHYCSTNKNTFPAYKSLWRKTTKLRQSIQGNVVGRFDPPVTVIMLSPGVLAPRVKLESLLRSSRILLYPNI